METPAVLVLGAVVAGFVQGLSGFAFSMVAMSFWVWVLEPHLAAALAVFGSLTGQVLAAVTMRRGFNAPCCGRSFWAAWWACPWAPACCPT